MVAREYKIYAKVFGRTKDLRHTGMDEGMSVLTMPAWQT